MKILQRTVFILFLFCFYSSFAQEGNEFFVRLDPFSGQFTKMSTLSGVKWITGSPCQFTLVDPIKKRVYFHGADENLIEYIYGVDIATGQLVSQASFPIPHNWKDQLYGVKYDAFNHRFIAFGNSFIASLDMESGTLTKIADFPKDSNINLYFCQAYDIDASGNFMAIEESDDKFIWCNTSNGEVIKTTRIKNLKYSVQKMIFDPNLGSVFAIANTDSSAGIFNFDVNTGISKLICSVASSISPNQYIAYDYRNSILYLESQGNGQTFQIIDISDKVVISSIPFPYQSSTGDNVICPVFDTTTNQLYALHWEFDIENQGQDWLKVYPNPTASKISIESAHPIQGVCIYTMLGQEILNDGFEDSGFKTYDLENLNEGEYLVVVRSNYQMLTQKILVKK